MRLRKITIFAERTATMHASGITRVAFAVLPTAALLAACGSAQMGSAPDATPADGLKQRAHSWIDPLASSGDLVYASAGKTVLVYAYRAEKMSER